MKNTRIVGNKTAELIVWLVTEGLSSYDQIHVLGSSLGAQAAGYVGHFTGVSLIKANNLIANNDHFLSSINCYFSATYFSRWEPVSHHRAGP